MPERRIYSTRRTRSDRVHRVIEVFRILAAVKLISWNVNGLRAVLKKNFLEFLAAEKPDILCLQETKCTPDDVEQLWPANYTTYWNCAEKKGYSGTAIFTKDRPLKVIPHIDIAEHDQRRPRAHRRVSRIFSS